MNVGKLGGGDVHAAREALGTAVAYRFGVRRLLPGSAVHRRITERRLHPRDADGGPGEQQPSRESTSPSVEPVTRQPRRT